MPLTEAIVDAISQATQARFSPGKPAPVGGGCINPAFKLSDGRRSYFIKTNSAERLDMFEAEAAGLEEILAAQCLRTPRPVCSGISDEQSFLVLEYLDLHSLGSGAKLGRQLACLHGKTAPQFGWKRDNTIGSTPQHNPWTDSWIAFLREHRFGYQLELAVHNGLGSRVQGLGEKLMARLESFFPGYTPIPSLLHGDLWGGNAAIMPSGEPVIFDPAVYFGDREADLAMTELFGGFGCDFYAAYQEAWPLDPGYSTRRTLYNLYHILNHANLFGGSYVTQAENMTRRLLADTG
jgi:protein-ribulosamine 3-kinase